MRLIDTLADKLSNIYLIDTSPQRKEARKKISLLGRALTYDIAKLIVCPNSSYRNDWIREVNSFLTDIDSISLGGNKKPRYEDYEEWIINKKDFHNKIGKILGNIKREYPNETINDHSHLRILILRIMKVICTNLAKDEQMDIKKYL
jgi:hypothetical protein